ncbi:MAG: UvrD-helicase domain-containing protein, partial [Candidatus Saccharimonadales bacterium]
MRFLIADTFTDSLAKLSGEDQKAAKTSAFDLQLNPASPGMSFHKLDRAKDKNFWSVRVNGHVRLIVHRTPESLLLCYVGHHDDAYEWAERRRLETHPQTGAAQLVEVRERVEEVAIPRYVEAPVVPAAAELPLFASVPDGELLRYGVPLEWLPEVRAATEDTWWDLADHLPGEAAEALLALATGTAPQVVEPVTAPAEAFSHPDAQRRFRIIANAEELERALEYPWEKWSVFLHPAQRESVERSYGGPARISGSAGTGKTVVALHRAVFLARSNPESRVLLTTFSEPLANALRTKLLRLTGNEPRVGERIDVYALDGMATRLYELNFGPIEFAAPVMIRGLIERAAAHVQQQKFSVRFLTTEWTEVVDAW